MSTKRRIIVKGNVQAVGYRALIKQIARNNGIKGSIKNLDDGTVEIYCGCNSEIYEEFKKKINLKATDTEDQLQINVMSIEEFNEDSEGFDQQKIIYPFEVLYDDKEIRPLEKELLERSEMAILAMTSMNSNLSKKVDNTNQNIKDMDQHMNEDFDKLDKKYDKFGNSLTKLEGDMKDIKGDIHEMKDAFIKLTNHFVKEEK